MQEDWLSFKTWQRGERECPQAPQGAAKASIRCVVPLAKGYGHSLQETPCGLNVLDSRRSHLHLFRGSLDIEKLTGIYQLEILITAKVIFHLAVLDQEITVLQVRLPDKQVPVPFGQGLRSQ